MTVMARIESHPSDSRVLCVFVGAADADAMGGFPAARWDPPRRCYVLLVDVLDEFERFARLRGMVVLDERGQGPRVAQGLPVGMPSETGAGPQWQPCPRCGDLVVLVNGNGRRVTKHECVPL